MGTICDETDTELVNQPSVSVHGQAPAASQPCLRAGHAGRGQVGEQAVSDGTNAELHTYWTHLEQLVEPSLEWQ